MANAYLVGRKVRASVAFTDSSGAAVDPGTVTAKYRDPTGALTSKIYPTDAEVVKTGTGAYYIDILLSIVGEWWWGFYGTVSNQAAAEQKLVVTASRMDVT